MKIIAIATLLLAVVFGLGVVRNKWRGTRTRTISAATIAKLPPGETYEVDLTRNGTLYKFKDEGTNFSRVTIRTAAGVKSFDDLLKLSHSPRGRLLLGTTADIRSQNIAMSTGGTTKFDCGGVCKCNGIRDCVDMFSSGSCSTESWCNLDTGNCFCVARP